MPRPRLPWIKLYKQILHSEIMILPEAYRWNFIGLLLIAADEPEAGTIRSFWLEKNGKILASKLQTSEYILRRTLEELEKYSIIFQNNGEIIFKNYHIYQGVSYNKPEKQTENNQKTKCLYRDRDIDIDKDINKKENKEKADEPLALISRWNKFCVWAKDKKGIKKVAKDKASDKTKKDISRFDLNIAGVKYGSIDLALSACLKYLSTRPELMREGWLNFEFLFAVKQGKNGITKIMEGTYDFHDKPKPTEDRRPEIIKEELFWRTTGTPLRICSDCGERSAREETANSMLGLRTRYICDDCKREFSADEWSGLKQAEKRDDETLDEFAERRAADFRREIESRDK